MGSYVFPTWPVVPTKPLVDYCFRLREKLEWSQKYNPYIYWGKPRLRTAVQLQQATGKISEISSEVTTPFLIVHGGADKVTDPEGSTTFTRKAASEDKECRIFPGYWHALLAGEDPEDIEKVFACIINWMQTRATKSA